ncbi:diguanylate cyclase [Desulfogranum mediterraneum]|uniref:diguanylate cyclase n=1 Tax=Desulfogranum mediterraneum TaxID=160661 RepID=UPI00041223C4|nr:diguanylate cyclase [Desulfogranum mediterraneum]
MKKTIMPLAWGVSAALAVILIFSGFDLLERNRFRESLKTHTIDELSRVRARLEMEINANLYLTRGLIVFVSINPGLEQEEFRRFSQELLRHKNYIRNIGLAPGNILSYLYPLKGNEKAIGLDYAANKKQWPAVKMAIESRKTVVAGPVRLVQGGEAFICRTPIYVASASPDENQDTYWGLASIVVDKDRLFQATGLTHPDAEIKMAIRGKDGLGAEGEIIEGDLSLFQQDPVLLDVNLPEGSWQLAGIPPNGWQAASPYLIWLWSCGGALSLLLGLGLFAWLKKQLEYQERIEASRTRAIEAREILAQKESFLKAIFANIPDIIFVKDAKDLSFIQCNRAAEELLGVPNQELIGKNEYHFRSKQEAEIAAKQDRFVLEGGETLDIPLKAIRTKDRGGRKLHTKKIPILDREDAPKYLLEISHDITERIKAEEQLATHLHYEKAMLNCTIKLFEDNLTGAVEQLASSLGASRVLIYKNIDTPEVGLCARLSHKVSTLELSPFNDADILDQFCYDTSLPRWREELQQERFIFGHAEDFPDEEKEALEADISSLLAAPIFVENQWWGFIRFDDTSFGIQYNSDISNFIKIASYAIGHYLYQKKIKRKLFERDERLSLIMETTLEGVWDWDVSTNEFYASAPLKKLCNIEKGDALSIDEWMSRVHPDHISELMETIDQNLKKSELFTADYLFQLPDESYQWQNIKAKALLDDDNTPFRMIASIKDISKEKKKELFLRKQSLVDELTQLYNRRYFDKRIKKEIARFQQKETPLSLLVIDIDHFKKFNDNYGHKQGDDVLAVLGRIIKENIREEDFGCRYGGEEFAVIMGNADHATACRVAERLRSCVERETFSPDPDQAHLIINATISIGISQCSSTDTASSLFKGADKALYQAKQLGRNRVVSLAATN